MAIPVASPMPSSLAVRRDRQPLPFLKTSFDDSLLQINSPRAPLSSKSATDLRLPSRKSSLKRTDTNASSKAPSIKKPSKSPILTLFHRPKAERARGHHEQDFQATNRSTPNFSRPGTSDGKPPAVPRPAMPKQKTSELRKVANNDSASATPPITRPNAQGDDMGFTDALRDLEPPKRSSPSSPLSSSWVPPPLFQAYPQAVLHSSLEDPGHHTLKITRAKRRMQNLSKSDEGLGATARRPSHSRPSTGRKASISSTIHGDPAVSKRVYVLSTSGYLMQYAGDGASDRRPEKTLKLGTKSVAFASDAIPGRHWVIQVLQAASDDEANPFSGQRSFLNRLLPSSMGQKRKATRSMLLVLDSPAEMNKWLHAIRHEICKFSDTPLQPHATSKRPPSADSRRKPNVPHRVLTMTRPPSSSNLRKPSSPTKSSKSVPSGPSMPNSPTYLDSGYVSSGTTLVSGSSDTSQRSSKQQGHGKTGSDHQHPAVRTVNEVAPVTRTRGPLNSEDYFSDDDTIVLQQPPNTAVPPLTPTIDVNIELAESPDQTMPSPDRNGNSQRSIVDSPEQQFYTPATTPMQALFPHNDEAKQPSPPRVRHSPKKPSNHQHEAPAEQRVQRASTIKNNRFTLMPVPTVRQNKVSPGLYSLNAPETPDSQRSTYFTQRTPQGSTDDLARPSQRGLVGNAFAQAAAFNQGHGHSPSIRTSGLPNLSTGLSAVSDGQAPVRMPGPQIPLPPLPKRTPSLQPLSLQTVDENVTSEKQPRRISIRSNAPLPLHTASAASERSSMKPVRESAVLDLGLGIQHPSGAHASDRDHALSQLVGGPHGRVGVESTQPSPNIDSFPTPSSVVPADRALRRPPSITVNTDVAPFLAPQRRASGVTGAAVGSSSAPVSAGTMSSRIATPSTATRTPLSAIPTPGSATSVPTPATSLSSHSTSSLPTRQRNSVLVPVVRPPMIRSGLKGSRQNLRLGSPPTTKPPEAPLPPPPTMAARNTQASGVSMAG